MYEHNYAKKVAVVFWDMTHFHLSLYFKQTIQIFYIYILIKQKIKNMIVLEKCQTDIEWNNYYLETSIFEWSDTHWCNTST